jgi:hypothetical protein
MMTVSELFRVAAVLAAGTCHCGAEHYRSTRTLTRRRLRDLMDSLLMQVLVRRRAIMALTSTNDAAQASVTRVAAFARHVCDRSRIPCRIVCCCGMENTFICIPYTSYM